MSTDKYSEIQQEIANLQRVEGVPISKLRLDLCTNATRVCAKGLISEDQRNALFALADEPNWNLHRQWKMTYYPVPAIAAKDAVAYDLQKWKGLAPNILYKHGLLVDGYTVDNSTEVPYNVLTAKPETCALCIHYKNDGCAYCPLARVRDGWPCDEDRPDENMAPYITFMRIGDPGPMVHWLGKI